MTGRQPEWLNFGKGPPPAQSWSFATDGALVDVQLARETGDALAADELGSLYRLDRNGRIQTMTRGFRDIRALALSEIGHCGAAVLGESQLCRFDERLQIRWTMNMPGNILAVAMDPFGHYIAAALDTGGTFIIGENKRRLCEFATIRPLHFLRFVVTDSHLIGAADYGVLQRQQLDGEAVWNAKLWNTVGDLTISGDGRLLYLAGFSHGIQVYDGEGDRSASYLLQGAPSRLSTSFDGQTIVAATQENYLYRMNRQGEMFWAAEAPAAAVRLHCDPVRQGFLCGFETGRIARFDWPT